VSRSRVIDWSIAIVVWLVFGGITGTALRYFQEGHQAIAMFMVLLSAWMWPLGLLVANDPTGGRS
jgi:hypothetical protein